MARGKTAKTTATTPKPKRFAYTYEDIAVATGVTANSVRHWAKFCGAPIISGQKNDLAKIRKWKAEYDKEKHLKTGPGKSAVGLRRERAEIRYRVARAAREEMRLAQEQGRLIAIEDVKAEMAMLATDVKHHLLSLPRKECDRLAAAAEASECEQILDEAVKDILRLLSKEDSGGER